MSIPQTQRAAVITSFGGGITVKTDHPVRQAIDLAPGECLIKMEFAGVCHSDLHVMKGDWARKAPLPIVGGHEGIGTVVSIGEHTASDEVKVGDRVGLKWIATACLRCEMCRKGKESSCLLAAQRSNGYMLDGAFAEYVVSFVNYVTPIPQGIDSASATPILCAGMTVYKALKQSNTSVGDWVSISGAGGGLGHLAVQYAVAMGLRVVAIDSGEEKRKLVAELGAEKWVDFRQSSNIIQDVQEATGGTGPHAAIIAAGDGLPFNQALMYLRPSGTLVAVGMPGNAILSVPITMLVAKSLKIVGSALGNRQDAIEALDLAARGKVHCHHEVRCLEDLNQIFSDLEAGKIAGRVVIKI